MITENQFICGLLLCLGKNSPLCSEDMQKVVKQYLVSDGRVHYKEFCDLMENGKLLSRIKLLALKNLTS